MTRRYDELAKKRASKIAERSELVQLQKIAERSMTSAISALEAEKLLYPGLAEDIDKMIKRQISACSKATRDLQTRIDILDLIYY